MYSLLAQVKVSKEVAQQRRFESGLLAGYQRLLQLLESRLEPPTTNRHRHHRRHLPVPPLAAREPVRTPPHPTPPSGCSLLLTLPANLVQQLD